MVSCNFYRHSTAGAVERAKVVESKPWNSIPCPFRRNGGK